MTSNGPLGIHCEFKFLQAGFIPDMITAVPDIGLHNHSDASSDKCGWELVLQCLDTQQKIHAEDIRELKSVLIQLSESHDHLKREIQDEKTSMRLELFKFREEFRSFCTQHLSCPACNHGASYDNATSSPRTLQGAAAELLSEQELSQMPATSPAKTNINGAPEDFTFHSTKLMIFNSEILMVLSKQPYKFTGSCDLVVQHKFMYTRRG